MDSFGIDKALNKNQRSNKIPEQFARLSTLTYPSSAEDVLHLADEITRYDFSKLVDKQSKNTKTRRFRGYYEKKWPVESKDEALLRKNFYLTKVPVPSLPEYGDLLLAYLKLRDEYYFKGKQAHAGEHNDAYFQNVFRLEQTIALELSDAPSNRFAAAERLLNFWKWRQHNKAWITGTSENAFLMKGAIEEKLQSWLEEEKLALSAEEYQLTATVSYLIPGTDLLEEGEKYVSKSVEESSLSCNGLTVAKEIVHLLIEVRNKMEMVDDEYSITVEINNRNDLPDPDNLASLDDVLRQTILRFFFLNLPGKGKKKTRYNESTFQGLYAVSLMHPASSEGTLVGKVLEDKQTINDETLVGEEARLDYGIEFDETSTQLLVDYYDFIRQTLGQDWSYI